MKKVKVEMISKTVLTVPKWLIGIFNLLDISVATNFFICLGKRKFRLLFLLNSLPDSLSDFLFSTLCPRRLASMDSFALWLLFCLTSGKYSQKIGDLEQRDLGVCFPDLSLLGRDHVLHPQMLPSLFFYG